MSASRHKRTLAKPDPQLGSSFFSGSMLSSDLADGLLEYRPRNIVPAIPMMVIGYDLRRTLPANPPSLIGT